MGKLLVLVFSHVMVNFIGGRDGSAMMVGLMYLQPTDGGVLLWHSIWMCGCVFVLGCCCGRG